jgi:hypothetical protein
MKIVFIYVEGPTEERFIKTVLQPHLLSLGIYVQVFTCYGAIKYQSQLRKFILQKANETGIDLVSTMFDFYKLPKDFPGKRNLPMGTCYDRVAHLEKAFVEDISHTKFVPYIMLHEFEALLFSSPAEIAQAFPDKDESHELQKIKTAHHNNPEEINDDEMTAPSKRIKKIYPSYDKVLQGPAIIQQIGLDLIRTECPHFNEWLRKLESLGQASS